MGREIALSKDSRSLVFRDGEKQNVVARRFSLIPSTVLSLISCFNEIHHLEPKYSNVRLASVNLNNLVEELAFSCITFYLIF